MRGEIKELLFIKVTVYLCFSFRKKKAKQNIAATKNSQEFLASQVLVLRRNKATNSGRSNHPFFLTANPCIF